MRVTQPNCWTQSRWPLQFPRGWPLGVITGPRKHATKNFMPGPRERMAIGRRVSPFWHVVNFALPARETADSQIVPRDNFALAALMATTDQPAPAGATFHARFFQVRGQAGYSFSRTGINGGNCLGTAPRPFYFRKPYWAPNGEAILCRAANTVAAVNNVQVVLFGYRQR